MGGPDVGAQRGHWPFKPYFFVGSPNDQALEDAYKAALNILKLSPFSPEVIEETRIEDLIRQIAREIKQSEESGTPEPPDL